MEDQVVGIIGDTPIDGIDGGTDTGSFTETSLDLSMPLCSSHRRSSYSSADEAENNDSKQMIQIEKARLDIEKERLEVEKMRLEEEKMRLLKDRLTLANPRALVHTMFLNNTLHFGMRTRLDRTELRWVDIELKQHSTGDEFLLYTERATKTRTGQSNDSRPFQPKMFSDPENPRCPVHAYNVFKDKRPAEMLKSESPFYIRVARSSKDQFDKWFIN
ncbi:unnamed protein product [Mytilus coruscus]|uniref:ZMYM2-like/QRICH1 C-terminal domain-containing protein n=1 Tax=Mytilus coruscus TaxID=42192 RepID=A0A6J8DI14_MYTCO|nr:unnamed protein product [Mytilus coruscus]